MDVPCLVVNRDLECRGVFSDAPTAIACVDEEGVLRFVNDRPSASDPGRVGAVDDGDGASDPFIGKDDIDILFSLNRSLTFRVRLLCLIL